MSCSPHQTPNSQKSLVTLKASVIQATEQYWQRQRFLPGYNGSVFSKNTLRFSQLARFLNARNNVFLKNSVHPHRTLRSVVVLNELDIRNTEHSSSITVLQCHNTRNK